jgi:hypothetical protein
MVFIESRLLRFEGLKNSLTPALSHRMGEGEHIPSFEQSGSVVSKKHFELAVRGETVPLAHPMGEGLGVRAFRILRADQPKREPPAVNFNFSVNV